MVKEVADRETVAAFVRAAREQLESGEHDDAADHAARRLGLAAPTPRHAAQLFAARLPENDLGPETEPESEEPFISRDPLVSLIQTSLAEQLDRNGLVADAPAEHSHHGLFGRVWDAVRDFVEDGRLKARGAEMVAEVVEGALARLADGTRLIVVGDWGFAGEAEEYRRNVLADGWWPVTAAQAAAGAGSWSLAGNHDLYGGPTPTSPCRWATRASDCSGPATAGRRAGSGCGCPHGTSSDSTRRGTTTRSSRGRRACCRIRRRRSCRDGSATTTARAGGSSSATTSS